MPFQRQEATAQEAALAWHQQQLIEVPLTNKEREYHRDMISWLEQQRAAGEKQRYLLQQRGVRARGRKRSGSAHRWLPALLAWLKQT